MLASHAYVGTCLTRRGNFTRWTCESNEEHRESRVLISPSLNNASSIVAEPMQFANLSKLIQADDTAKVIAHGSVRKAGTIT